MGTSWRRAFCTTIPRDPDSANSDKQQKSSSHSPSQISKLGLFSSASSNPSTPRLRCRTSAESAPTPTVNGSPKLECTTTTTPKSSKSPTALLGSNQSSPRSPLKLSLFKKSFKFRSSCGICLNSVKTGQGTAIYTAECAHAFHFPCIAAHVRKHGSLVCPVCNTTWKDVPLLAVHKNLGLQSHDHQNDTASEKDAKPKVRDQKVIESSPRAVKTKRELQHFKPSDSRSYDDDEPLLSPTACSPILPIPEVDEDCDGEENDVEEFQGFFVNPSISSSINNSDEAKISAGDWRNIEVKISPESAVISTGRNHETYAVALRVKAPPSPPPSSLPAPSTTTAAPLLDPAYRAPIDLVTVLDVNGSMTGAKLQMLKRAMRLVISSLGSADRLSIVAFSASPKRLLPLRRMTAQGQSAARRIVDRLVCGQGTSVGDALRKATKVLEDRRERNPVASIMLLSDGRDERVPHNEVNQRHASRHVSSTRFAHIEIPVHSFGYGENGSYSEEPAEDAFAKCVGGLLSVVLQDLKLELHFASGSAPAEICGVYSCNQRPTVLGLNSVRVGDLYAEEERELLVELRVPKPSIRTHHLICVKPIYKDPATQDLVYPKEQALLVPRPHAIPSSVPRIQRLRNLFITTRAIAESRRLLHHNDYTSAHQLLDSARALLLQSSAISAEEYVRELEAEMAELHWRRHCLLEQQKQMMIIQRRRLNERERDMVVTDENGEPLTPTSAWKAAEKLANVAKMKKSLNRVSDLHGFENARF